MTSDATDVRPSRHLRHWLLGWIVFSLAISAPFWFVGCIPGYRAFRPVLPQELRPTKAPHPAAEWLWRQWTYFVGSGPDGSDLWRGTFRLRVNQPAGLKAALLTLPQSTALEHPSSRSPLVFSRSTAPRIWARTTCPGQKKAVYLNRLTIRERRARTRCLRKNSLSTCLLHTYLARAPNVTKGCVVDVYFDVFAKAPVKGSLAFPIHSTLPVKAARYRVLFPGGQGLRTSLHHMPLFWRHWAEQWQTLQPGRSFSAFLSQKKVTSEPLQLSFDLKRRRVQLLVRKLPAWSPTLLRKLRWQGYDLRRMQTPFWLVQLEPHHPTPSTWTRKSWAAVVQRLRRLHDWRGADKQLDKNAFPVLPEGLTRAKKLRFVIQWLQTNIQPQQKRASSLRVALKERKGSLLDRTLLAVVWLQRLKLRAFLALTAPENRTFQDTEPQYAALTEPLLYIAPAHEGSLLSLAKEQKQGLSATEIKELGLPRTREGFVHSFRSNRLAPGIVPASASQLWSLVLDPRGGRWFKTPSLSPSQHQLQWSLNGALDNKGFLRGRLLQQQRGLKVHALAGEVRRWPDGWKDWLRQLCPRLTKSKANALQGSPDQGIDLNLPCLAVKKGRSELRLPVAVPRFQHPKQAWKSPLDLGAPRRVLWTLTLKLPPKARLQRCCQMKERKLQGHGFSLSMQDSQKGGVLSMTSRYEHKQRFLSGGKAQVVRLWLRRAEVWKQRGTTWKIDWTGQNNSPQK